MASDEDILRDLRESYLEQKAILQAHERDIHRIADSIKSIDASFKKMTEFQVQQAVRDEKFESRLTDAHKTAERAHKRLDEHDVVFKRVMWLLITPIIVALLSTVIYKTSSNSSLDKKLGSIERKLQSLEK